MSGKRPTNTFKKVEISKKKNAGKKAIKTVEIQRVLENIYCV